MWLRRLAALVAAAALVVAAFVIRDRRSSSNGSASPAGTVDSSQPAGRFRLACAPELRRLCEGDVGAGVDVQIEVAGTTAARLAAAADPRTVADAWLTVDPWPALSDQRRAAGGTSFAPLQRLGRSPVGLAIRAPRGATLAAACGGTVTLGCVGDKAGTSWSSLGGDPSWQVFKPTFSDPSTSATGPAALAAAVRQRRADTALTLIELQGDPAFGTWLRSFNRPPNPPDTSALTEAVTRVRYDAVVLPEAELRSADGADRFEFVGQTPYDAVLVLAPTTGAKVPDALAKALGARLVAAGWQAGASASTVLDANLVAGFRVAWEESA